MSHQLQKTKNWKFILTVTFGFLFALSRDSNAYLVFFISLPLLLISKQRQLGLVLIIIAFSGFWSNHISQRWVPAFYNVISYRIIPKPSHLLFFEKNGMPVTKALMKREKKPYWSDNNAYSENSDLENFRQWAQKSGKTTYVKFLITHPIYLFLSPIKNISGMLSDRMSRYKTKSTPSGFNNNIFDFKITTYFYLLVLFGSIISLFFLRNKYKNQFLLIKMSLAIIILTFPTILIIWHADPLALNRHGLNVAIQFRLGLLISLVAGLDAILLKGKNGRLANQQ
jgi:predicted membrane protein